MAFNLSRIGLNAGPCIRCFTVSAALTAMKSPVPIKWVRPEKIPCYKPEKSGDLKPLIQIPKDEVPLEFRDCDELKNADDTVKRLFTLEFFPMKNTRDVLRKTYMDEVKRHNFDTTSPEARVARMTATIRWMQERMEAHPTDKLTKVRLKQLIDKRKKIIKLLRNDDYKRFEWLLEKMDLIFRPEPPLHVWRRVERKRSLRMLTEEYCEKIVNDKLNNLKESLASQQEQFLQSKIDTMKRIIKDEIECGISPSFTQEDIDKEMNRLNAIRESRKKETVVQE